MEQPASPAEERASIEDTSPDSSREFAAEARHALALVSRFPPRRFEDSVEKWMEAPTRLCWLRKRRAFQTFRHSRKTLWPMADVVARGGIGRYARPT
eukprot:2362761-Prymnesium_polylepis.1